MNTQRRYVSDLHFAHPLVARFREYDNAEAHDRAMIRLWLNSVPNDTTEVHVLGDISAGGAASEAQALATLAVLPGRKHLVLGNHERGHGLHRNGRKHLRAYYDVFESVTTLDHVSIDGNTVMMSHFPYGDEDHVFPPRYGPWRPADTGHFLACGHVHDQWAEKHRMFNVGVDVRQDRFVTDRDLAEFITRTKRESIERVSFATP